MENTNKKLSCCCDSRSYCCMPIVLHEWLKVQRDLTDFCFNAIQCDRSRRIIIAGNVIRAERGTEQGVRKLLANYQTSGYKCM